MRRSGLVALAFLLGVAAAPAASATSPGAAGLLAFQSDRDGDYGIWISSPDGSSPRALYDPIGSHEFNPSWSPDGRTLVLQTGPLDRSTFDIVAVDVLTGRVTPVVSGPENDRQPQFCGSDTIVFSRRVDAQRADIYSIAVDGSDLTRLTDSAFNSTPTCSPDRAEIAFASNRAGEPSIWRVGRDGSSPRLLVQGGIDPDYSPDGTSLAYAARDTDGNTEAYVMNLASRDVTQVTFSNPPIENRLPHFLPSYGPGVVLAGGPVPAGSGVIALLVTAIDSALPFPEVNSGVLGVSGPAPLLACQSFPEGAPGVPPNPPAADPGAPGNNSAIVAQPTVSCAINEIGTLTVTGTDGADRIWIGSNGAGDITVEANGVTTVYPKAAVTAVRVLGKGGHDDLDSFAPVPVDLDGGAGINAIRGSVHLQGTEGPDHVVVRTTLISEGRATGTITFNGETATFDGRADVALDDFNTRDTVTVDPESRVRITDWLVTGPVPISFSELGPSRLTVFGTAQSDRITVKVEQNGPLRIARNGEGAPAITGSIGGIEIAGGGGDDTIDSNVPVGMRAHRAPGGRPQPLPVRIRAGGGSDRVTCRGAAQRCTVIAGAGNDIVDVLDGTRSVVDGGPGTDRVRADHGDRVRRAETVLLAGRVGLPAGALRLSVHETGRHR